MNRSLKIVATTALVVLAALLYLMRTPEKGRSTGQTRAQDGKSRPPTAPASASTPVLPSPPPAPKTSLQSFEELWDEVMRLPSDHLLIMAEFKRLGGTVNESILDADIASIVRGSFHGDQQAFEIDLASKGLTIDSLRQQRRDKYLAMFMKSVITKGITDPQEKARAFQEWLAKLRSKAGISNPG